MSLNVLITSGSRRVALLRGFQRAVGISGGGAVVVTDVNPLAPTVSLADRSYPVPYSTDPAYLDAIAAICQTERIGLIVPTIDDELTTFALAAPRFAARGIRVAVSPPETTQACNDKRAAYDALSARGLPTAVTYLKSEVPADPTFPLFIKPRFGRGGVAAYVVQNRRELEFFLDYVPDPVVQPYLDGPEFTIDLLCDFAGDVLSVVPRQRVVIRAGVVDRGCTVRDPKLIDLGLACARAMTFIGAVNIQCRVVNGEPTIFEINPRFSGGIGLTMAAGADFPRALVALASGRRVPPSIGRYQADLWMSSYETSVFKDAASIGFSSAPAQLSIPEVA